MHFLSYSETKSYCVAHIGLYLGVKPIYIYFEELRLLGTTMNFTCFLSYVGPIYYICMHIYMCSTICMLV